MPTSNRSALLPVALLAIIATSVLILSGLAIGTASAARQNGRGGGKVTATLSVSPNPVPVGTTEVTVSGTGFKAGEGLLVGIAGVMPGYGITADASGDFSFTYSKAGSEPFSAGSYPFEAWGWKGQSRILRASTMLVVQ